MKTTTFPLNSEDCELLLFFEQKGSIRHLARIMNRDESVISRQLKRVSEKAPVLEKIKNQWKLTELGKKVNRWSAEGIDAQRTLLAAPLEIRIGASRSFATKVLAPQIEGLKLKHLESSLHLVCFDEGAEPALLKGQVDIAFSCGKPTDPQIAFQRLIPERYVAVGSPQTNKTKSLNDLATAPHLLLQKNAGETPFLEMLAPHQKIATTFNDPLCILEALRQGQGWSILPYFSVKEEVLSGKLKVLSEIKIPSAVYGIWWMRARTSLKPWVEHASNWLKAQELC